MGFIRKEIGEREKKLLEDFSIEEKELALPFLLEDEKNFSLRQTISYW